MHYLDAHNIHDLREAARQRLPRVCFDWLEGGTEDHLTWRRNRAAFEEIRFSPHVLVNVGNRWQKTELFGKTFESPFGIAPTGAAGLYGYRADIALARAAQQAGVPFILSTASFDPLEEVAKAAAAGTLWFQLYMSKNRESAGRLVQRALDAGFEALVVTGDVPMIGNREYNKRNRFSAPFRLTSATLLDGLMHPRWLTGVFLKTLLDPGVPRYQERAGQPPNHPEHRRGAGALPSRRGATNFDWEDFDWLRQHRPRKLYLKGVLRADDARCWPDNTGADGVFVSETTAGASSMVCRRLSRSCRQSVPLSVRTSR